MRRGSEAFEPIAGAFGGQDWYWQPLLPRGTAGKSREPAELDVSASCAVVIILVRYTGARLILGWS